ncbi:MAG TPA: translation initiation factor IF-3, partial [bacterium]|nr:translation initiation factor IF-3 [bacterium]
MDFQKPSLHKINGQITAKEVRLIGAAGEQIGILSLSEALKRAEESELDLVEISPTAQPPVCKIMDYRKFLFEKKKKEKEARKKQKVSQLKEIKLSAKISDHDLQHKREHIIK